MAQNHDEINFRDMAEKFLLVKKIGSETKMVIEKSGLKIRQGDNAMLVFGYIDYLPLTRNHRFSKRKGRYLLLNSY